MMDINMNVIQLAQWRDAAIEHLPEAQQYREQAKLLPLDEDRDAKTYAEGLRRIAAKIISRNEATAPERAAAYLLLALTDWETFDPATLPALNKMERARNPAHNDMSGKDMRAAMLPGIENAVKTLANVTGRNIPMDDPVAYFGTPAMPADAPAAKVATQQRQRQDALAVELDAILVSMETRTPAKVMAKLREQIGKLNTCITANVGDGITWENDRGDVKTLTIAALGERIKEWKKTGLSQG